MPARLERPSRVLAGDLRHNLAVTRAVAAWVPFVALAVLLVLTVLGWIPRAIGAVLIVAALAPEARWRGYWSRRWRSAWWRTRWWFDARAAGLCVIADPAVNATAEKGGRMAKGIELAPRLLRVKCTKRSRMYVVKALPGQSFEDFEEAVAPLSYRWGANVTAEPHERRRRIVLLEVVNINALAEAVQHPARSAR